MLRGYSFRPHRLRPRYGALALAAIACVAFVLLGNWQSRRADEKREVALQLDEALRAPPIELAAAALDPRTLVHRHVAAHGRFVAEHTIFLDNKLRRGRAGYEVVTPLKLGESAWHVLVNRGWVAAGPTREQLPQVPTPAGEQHIDGIALERIPHALQAGAEPAGKVRQNLDIAAFAAETGLELEPLVLEQHSETNDGLQRDWPRADLGIERNESYALQWYSFAALAIVLGVALCFRRATSS
jgi:surfeit locus 1 family protein